MEISPLVLTASHAYGLNVGLGNEPRRKLCQAILFLTDNGLVMLFPQVDYPSLDNVISGVVLLTVDCMPLSDAKGYCVERLANAGLRGDSWIWENLDVGDGRVDINIFQAANLFNLAKGKCIVGQNNGFLEFQSG